MQKRGGLMPSIVGNWVSRVFLVLAILLLLQSLRPLRAQEGPSPITNENGIRLELRQITIQTANGEQDYLTIRIINDGGESVSLPKPTEFCGDSLGGFVMVYSKVLRPAKGSDSGTGCVVDRVGHEDILAEAATWITIAPGSSYDITVPLIKAVAVVPGAKYELHATYHSPYLKASELNTLEAHGIHAAQGTVNSATLILDRPDGTDASSLLPPQP